MEEQKVKKIKTTAKLLLLIGLICFFGPFVMISCDGESETYSGMEMMTTITYESLKGSGEFDDRTIRDESPNYYLIAAFVLGIVSLIIICNVTSEKTTSEKSKLELVSGACAVGGTIFLYLFKSKFWDFYDEQLDGAQQYIDVDFKCGYTLSFLSFICAALCIFIAYYCTVNNVIGNGNIFKNAYYEKLRNETKYESGSTDECRSEIEYMDVGVGNEKPSIRTNYTGKNETNDISDSFVISSCTADQYSKSVVKTKINKKLIVSLTVALFVIITALTGAYVHGKNVAKREMLLDDSLQNGSENYNAPDDSGEYSGNNEPVQGSVDNGMGDSTDEADDSDYTRFYNEVQDIESVEGDYYNWIDINNGAISYNKKADELYSLWDRELNDIWKRLNQTLSADEMQKLYDEEMDWVAYKENAAKEAGKKYEGKDYRSFIEYQKSAEITKERVYYLLNYLE